MKLLEKRIYEDFSPQDGFRVLVDRLWPRGESKEDAHLDLWAKDISPSNELRVKYHEDPNGYEEFSRDYIKELKANPNVPDFVQTLKKHDKVTFLTSVKEINQSHVPVLINFIEKNYK